MNDNGTLKSISRTLKACINEAFRNVDIHHKASSLCHSEIFVVLETYILEVV
jgi:hypothetical protein